MNEMSSGADHGPGRYEIRLKGHLGPRLAVWFDGFTIANASTAAAHIYAFDIDCRARKRYLKLTVTPLTTQEVVMSAHLGRAKEAPDTTTEAGVVQLVHG